MKTKVNYFFVLPLLWIFSLWGCTSYSPDEVILGKKIKMSIGEIKDGVIGGGLGRDEVLWTIDSIVVSTDPIVKNNNEKIKWSISDLSYETSNFSSNFQTTYSPKIYDIPIEFVVVDNKEIIGKSLIMHINASVRYLKAMNPIYDEVILGVNGFESTSDSPLQTAILKINQDFQLQVLPLSEIRKKTFESYYKYLYITIGILLFFILLLFLGTNKIAKLMQWVFSVLVMAIIIWLIRSCN